MSSNGKILDLPSVSSAELREPFADPTAVRVLGRAEREPALQHKDFLVATPELSKDNCRVLGVGGCRLSAVAVAFCSFNRCVAKDSVRGVAPAPEIRCPKSTMRFSQRGFLHTMRFSHGSEVMNSWRRPKNENSRPPPLGSAEVLVAGVRGATQTPPPMRSGKRVVFLSLDDGSGPVSNVVFFHDAQAQIGAPVFRTHYALIRGRTRRTGARGVSVTGEQMWDLLDVAGKVRARQTAERERERVVVEAEAAGNVIQMWKRRA